MDNTFSMNLVVESPPNFSLQVDQKDKAIKLQEAVDVILHQEATVYYDTSYSWNMQRDLVSEKGVIYVYSDKATIYDEYDNPILVPGIKIGDGSSFLIDMPFIGDDILFHLSEHISDNCHITDEERIFWNNKVSASIDPNNPERLVLSTQ